MIGIGWARDPKTNEGLCYDANGKEVRRAKGEGKGGFHGAAHVYECKVIAADPITKGLPAKWTHIKDEALRQPARTGQEHARAGDRLLRQGQGRHRHE